MCGGSPCSLGEPTVEITGVEVRSIDTIGVQPARRFVAEVDEPLVLPLEVAHEVRQVVIPLLAGAYMSR